MVIPIALQQLKAFMEEDQQDSGGEYDLQEGFDRFHNLWWNTWITLQIIPMSNNVSGV